MTPMLTPLLLALLPLQDPAPVDPPEADRTPVAGETQEPAKPERPDLPRGLRDKLKKPFADLKPGVLPAGTDPAAGALFGELVAGSRLDEPGAVQGAVTAFDLAFELIVRGEGVERNQFETRVRFAEPGHVRFAVRDQFEMGYGGKAYWQIMEDGYRELSGRDYAADRKRIVEVRAVCRNFLALAEPKRLRVSALRPVAGLQLRSAEEVLLDAPVVRPVPEDDEDAPRLLRWLEVESPDFDLALGAVPDAPDASRLFRATIGIDPSSGRVAEALVQELGGGKPLLSTSTWVTLGRHLSIDGVLLPEAISVRYPERTPPGAALRFEEKPREEMYLLEGHLNPKLGPKAFTPQ